MPDVRQFLGMDGQPKYFLSEEKAKAFLEKRKAMDTHTYEQVGEKFVIKAKEINQ